MSSREKREREADSMPMPETWRLQMLERMKLIGMTQVMLAERLGVTPANVNRMLKPEADGGYHNSVHAVAAGQIVGVPLPLPSDATFDEGSELLRRLHSVSPMAYASRIDQLRRDVETIEKAVISGSRKKRPK